MKTKTLQDKKELLLKKGYDLTDKDVDFIESLYRIYRPNPAPEGQGGKPWKMWDGTNRPPQFRH